MASWTFLSNHAHVLLCVAADPDRTLHDIAERVGITERGVQLILADLIAEGYLERERVGRRNHYKVHPEGRLRHPLEAHRRVADLVAALGLADAGGAAGAVRNVRTDSAASRSSARKADR
jgi:DNA-binding MarR family transcriptional regulator